MRRGSVRGGVLAALALGLLPAGSLVAQESLDAQVEGRAGVMRVAGAAATGGAPLTGRVLGLRGIVGWWWLVGDVRYAEGSLGATGGAVRWDVVEGEATLGFRPVRWFTVSGGRLIRSYVTPEGVRRTSSWHGAARLDAVLLVNRLESYVDLWRMLSGDANTALVDGGLGAEAGVRITLPWNRASLGASYRVERTTFGGGLWRETTEQVGLSIGMKFGPRPR